MSKSQLGQDINVVNFYKEKPNGFFIEIGANDGVLLSNTFLLEKHYGWTGICAEPIPSSYKKLVINRENSKCCDSAVYSESGLVLVFDISKVNDLLSGISVDIDCHKKTVDSNKTSIHVNTISLLDLLKKYDAPKFIEYMSIDTEGSEYEILKTFNFNEYTFGLIDIEHNWIEPKRTLIRTLLESNNYVYIGPNNFDDVFCHKSFVTQHTYYYKEDLSRPITLSVDASNRVIVSSSYWRESYGKIEGNRITLTNGLGYGIIAENDIKFNNNTTWSKIST